MSAKPIETMVHLHPGTAHEREVRVRATVSLSHGRYRIDRLEALGGGHIGAHELEAVYERVIDQARSFGGLSDDASGR